MKLLEKLIVLTLVLGLFAVPAFSNEVPGTEEAGTSVAKTKTGISWQVEPEQVVIYLDGKRLGTAGKLKFTKTRPGKHTVRLTLKKDESEMDIEVKKGQTLKFLFKFDQS